MTKEEEEETEEQGKGYVNSIDLGRQKQSCCTRCSLTAVGKRDNSLDETNTPRQRREGRGGNAPEVHPRIWKCSGCQSPAAFDWLPDPSSGCCDPQSVALTTFISAHFSKLQHPSKTHSRIDNQLRNRFTPQLDFNKATYSPGVQWQQVRKYVSLQIASVTTHAQHAAKHVSPRCYSDNHMNHNKFAFDSSFETLACTFRR